MIGKCFTEWSISLRPKVSRINIPTLLPLNWSPFTLNIFQWNMRIISKTQINNNNNKWSGTFQVPFLLLVLQCSKTPSQIYIFQYRRASLSGKEDRMDKRRERLNRWIGSSCEFQKVQGGISRKTTDHKKTLWQVITWRMHKINHSGMGKEHRYIPIIAHMGVLEGKGITLLQATKD